MRIHPDPRLLLTDTPRMSRLIRLWRLWPYGLTLLLLVLLWVASDIAVPASLSLWTRRLQGFVTVFLGIFIEALPFLLAGVLMSSCIHLYVSEERIRNLSPRNPGLAALGGSLLGFAFPVCECGSIPATRRLLAKGASLPTGIAFALAAPVINPIVLISTYVAFASWEMVAWRFGLTILFAVIVGMIVGTPPRRAMVLADRVCQIPGGDDYRNYLEEGDLPGEQPVAVSPVRRVLGHASTEFFEMSRYLVIGAMLASALQTLVPQQELLVLGNGLIVSVVVMMALAVVLSICSTVDAFVALSFVNTFTPGAILAFLVFGPMIDIKSALLLTTTFRRHTVAIMVVLCFLLTLLAGVVVNFYF